MTDAPALSPAKRPHVWELVYFALDASYGLYQPYSPDPAPRMRALATTLVEDAGLSADPARLEAALAALPRADAAFVTRWVNDSFMVEDRLTSSLYLVFTAMGRGWLDALGFSSRKDFEAALSPETYTAFDALAEQQNTLFLALDDAMEAQLNQPVTPRDQRLIAAYPGLGTIEDALGYMADYIQGEALRAGLAALSLDASALAVLDTHMNARLARGGTGMSQVAWAEIVA